MSLPERIKSFLARGPYAVVGASADREKYGNKVLRCYLQHGLDVHAVNPRMAEVEGVVSYPDLRSVPAKVRDRLRNASGKEAAQQVGVDIAREALRQANDIVEGVYIMPPFLRFELVARVLEGII